MTDSRFSTLRALHIRVGRQCHSRRDDAVIASGRGESRRCHAHMGVAEVSDRVGSAWLTLHDGRAQRARLHIRERPDFCGRAGADADGWHCDDHAPKSREQVEEDFLVS
jgi:hypothetical protein